jgi:hypothetical protein
MQTRGREREVSQKRGEKKGKKKGKRRRRAHYKDVLNTYHPGSEIHGARECLLLHQHSDRGAGNRTSSGVSDSGRRGSRQEAIASACGRSTRCAPCVWCCDLLLMMLLLQLLLLLHHLLLLLSRRRRCRRRLQRGVCLRIVLQDLQHELRVEHGEGEGHDGTRTGRDAQQTHGGRGCKRVGCGGVERRCSGRSGARRGSVLLLLLLQVVRLRHRKRTRAHGA